MNKVVSYTISGEKFQATLSTEDIAILETMAAGNDDLKIIGVRELSNVFGARRRNQRRAMRASA